MFEFTTWLASFPDFFIILRCYTVIGKQLLISVTSITITEMIETGFAEKLLLGLSQDGALTDFFENLSVNSLKGDLSNATTFNPSLFSLVDTFEHF
jgi:hypothetical protein